MGISVNVSISGNTPAELGKELSAIVASLEMLAKQNNTATTTKTGKKSVVEQMTDAPEAEETETDLGFGDSEPEEPAPKKAPKKTLDQVIKAFQVYAKANGRDKAAKILGRYNTKSVQDLHENKYAEIIKLLEA